MMIKIKIKITMMITQMKFRFRYRQSPMTYLQSNSKHFRKTVLYTHRNLSQAYNNLPKSLLSSF